MLYNSEHFSIDEKAVKDSDIFLISPVRGATEAEKEFLVDYRKSLEQTGKSVYIPFIDTDQTDRIGLKICRTNRAAILKAKEGVHVIWNGKSEGSMFDLGMAYMARKDIAFVKNPFLQGVETIEDAFYSLRAKFPDLEGYNISKTMEQDIDLLERKNTVELMWVEQNLLLPLFLFKFGMAFMNENNIKLTNPGYLGELLVKDEGKSFRKVLMALHEKTISQNGH